LNKKHRTTDNIESIADRINQDFSTKDTVRENTLRRCREIIRYSAQSIRAIHRQEQNTAEELLNRASTVLLEMYDEINNNHSDLLHTGFIHDAQKEFAEASITISVITSRPFPEPESLKVSYAAYLNGMGEAVGELRRYLLDSLRRNDFSRCEEFLSTMDEIYSVLVTMDFPDAITHGLRRTTDSVRGILEKTRGDLTLILKLKEH
jgi:translin